MCKRNSPQRNKASVGCVRETPQVERSQHGMCKRNSPVKNEASTGRVRETPQNKNEDSTGCVRETPHTKKKKKSQHKMKAARDV